MVHSSVHQPSVHPSSPAGPVPFDRLVAELPEVRTVGADEVASARDGGPCLVFLDDDPTGTQTVADTPVLTTWAVADLRWALRQPGGGFFVLTSTRGLAAGEAAARNREVVAALAHAAEDEGVDYILASGSDSTLRGHYPLETHVLATEQARHGKPVDGIVIVPAYPQAGRVTVDGVHWIATPEAMVPVGESEFARDARFEYRNSDLRCWVEEKTGGRIPAGEVVAITCADLRTGGPDHVAALLGELSGGATAVVDATCEDDLRVLALAVIRAEAAGSRLLYRVGPAFARARMGQAEQAPLTSELATGNSTASGTPHGLVAVGSPASRTTRQLAELRGLGGITEFELDVPALLNSSTRAGHIAELAGAASRALSDSDVVISTSRTRVTGDDPDTSLAIARGVSTGLADAVAATVGANQPAWVVAKGGITSSDIATDGLGIRRAVARGTMLPGMISLWEPVTGPFAGTPYVVFAGNAGEDGSLREVVATLRGR